MDEVEGRVPVGDAQEPRREVHHRPVVALDELAEREGVVKSVLRKIGASHDQMSGMIDSTSGMSIDVGIRYSLNDGVINCPSS